MRTHQLSCFMYENRRKKPTIGTPQYREEILFKSLSAVVVGDEDRTKPFLLRITHDLVGKAMII